ncbi:MAG: GNAT family N-acetyltransferase [Lachnospiraceae bacterium]|nr:GNAT family N-acetyltransferase [Lachnospiraceae bacterium]
MEENGLKFSAVKPGNVTKMERLAALWIPYMREIYADDMEFHDTVEELRAGLAKRVRTAAIQKNMYFELAENAEGEAVGFVFYALDRGGISGILPAGYGYIMEVYVAPENRRHGYATEMYRHMRDTFAGIGVRTMYLTPDSHSGVPFWKKMGFRDSGLTDPDNHMPIYVRGIE